MYFITRTLNFFRKVKAVGLVVDQVLLRPPTLTRQFWSLGVLISLQIINSGNSCAQQTELPLSVKAPISAVFPNSTIVNGDLNNDGISDLAILVSEEMSNGITDRLVIYRGKTDGSYGFFAKSLGIQHGTADLKIKRKTLYITTFHNSLKESYNEIYQFKYLAKSNGAKSNGFFLIGKEETSYTPDDGNKYVVSVNYLTGKRIEREKINGQTKEIKSQLNKVERNLLRLEEFSI